MSELLVGTTLLVSLLGGIVALLAPCCVSVMLPAYLATGFRHRGAVLGASLVFGAGVSTVILPIGLGAAALSRLFVGQHLLIYLIGGLVMFAAGVAVLLGWSPKLPMPSSPASTRGGLGSAYLLGAFSGIASACCAPVLAGIAVLSGAAASFPVALAIGLAYVGGMVAPLAVAGLLWDRHRDRAGRLLSTRTVRLRVGGWARGLSVGTLISGVLMIGMGGLAGVLAFAGPGMSTDGWQTRASAWLAHVATLLAGALAWIPGWVVALVLLLGLVAVLRRAVTTHAAGAPEPPGPPPPAPNAEPHLNSETRDLAQRALDEQQPAVDTAGVRET